MKLFQVASCISLGTTVFQVHANGFDLTPRAAILSLSLFLFNTGIVNSNDIRDIAGDKETGKWQPCCCYSLLPSLWPTAFATARYLPLLLPAATLVTACCYLSYCLLFF